MMWSVAWQGLGISKQRGSWKIWRKQIFNARLIGVIAAGADFMRDALRFLSELKDLMGAKSTF